MRRVERLEGNVALVEVTPVIGHPAHAGDAISAAMSLAADADALVLNSTCAPECPLPDFGVMMTTPFAALEP